MRSKCRLRLEPLEGRDLPSSGLNAVVTTNHKVYQPGQAVLMTLTETNKSDRDLQVSVGATLGGFTVSQHGKELWRSDSPIQPLFARIVILHPGESLTQTAAWSGETPEGQPAHKLGTFTVRAGMARAKPVVILIAAPQRHPIPAGENLRTHPIGGRTSR